MLDYCNMKTTGKLLVLFAVFIASTGSSWAKNDRQTSQFNEIFHLIRTNLPGIDAESLEKDAIRRLLRGLGDDVELVGKKGRDAQFDGELLAPIKSYEDSFGYVRVRNVEAGLAEAIHQGLRELKPEAVNGGVMVDLRFAKGFDYEAAVWTANQFVSRDETQLVVGDRNLRLTQNTNLIHGPVAVLVNAETTGAAEALATLLRKNDVGLVIGNPTSGRTKVFSSFDLTGGTRLRIATGDVTLGNGAILSVSGLAPDIAVDVKLADERVFFGDAYALPNGKSKRKRHVNEADLVRQLTLKLNPDAKLKPSSAVDQGKKEVFDPVLARALDLLKGLDTLKRSK